MSAEFFTGEHGITYSGKKFWPEFPERSEIDIEDIARALSRLCRFGGHCRFFYSVAQHSVLLANEMPTLELKRIALMHDAPEAYTQDIIRAVKRLLKEYKPIEAGFWKIISTKFNLPLELPQIVKDGDNRILLTERHALISSTARWDLDDLYEPFETPIFPMGPDAAFKAFMQLANEIL
jgi:hypothetical protein